MNISGIYKMIAFEPENGFEPTTVEFVKTLRCGERDDLIWANLNHTFGRELVILASRHVGSSLLNIVKFPMHVYICLPKHDDHHFADNLAKDEISIKFWGLLLDAKNERSDLRSIFT